MDDTTLGPIALCCVIGLYIAPSLIGFSRGVRSVVALTIINVLFGWTLIGWFVCLLWACLGGLKAQDDFYKQLTRPPQQTPNKMTYDTEAHEWTWAPKPDNQLFMETYARERARLDHEAGLKNN